MGARFFTSPIGLGHVTRDIAIAGCLRKWPDFVTGGGAAQLLRMSEKSVQDVYSPPAFAVRGGTLHSRAAWLWRYYRYYARCRGIARNIIGGSPGVIISDEDFASLAVAQEAGATTILITDILETRFTRWPASIIEKRMNRAMSKIVKKCDLVILPEHGKDEGNIRRVGPIVRGITATREQLRKKFSLEKKTILVTVGGTDAGAFLIKKAVDAAKGIDADVIVAPGPAIRGEFPGARNAGFVENLHEMVFASDVIVSLAGRSTMDEARAYGTPGIFIPVRGHFEQEDNAKRAGFAHYDADRLGELICEKLGERRGAPDAGGARRAAELIEAAESNRPQAGSQ